VAISFFMGLLRRPAKRRTPRNGKLLIAFVLVAFEDHGKLKDRRSTEAVMKIVVDGLVLKLLTKSSL